jgi:hypothetical protein
MSTRYGKSGRLAWQTLPFRLIHQTETVQRGIGCGAYRCRVLLDQQIRDRHLAGRARRGLDVNRADEWRRSTNA